MSAILKVIDQQGNLTEIPAIKGSDGADGAAATIAVGTVTTGNAGTPASVVNSGSSSAAVFDFVIPRGADGQSTVSTNTDTNISGLLKGSGGKVAQAVAGTDYAAANHTHSDYAAVNHTHADLNVKVGSWDSTTQTLYLVSV